MKKDKRILVWAGALMIVFSLQGCDLIADIFTAGFWVGIIITVLVIALIIWLIIKGTKWLRRR